MSTTVDNRVVEMRFDNKHFESNVRTSMSTLEKLKQSLNLKGASKGLEGLNTAARKVDLSSISNSADTVGLRFNAMYTIADQALRNITNSAMIAGKKIVSALAIDPIKTGFQEYETQINAVQTILANTQSKGTTLDDVNKALDTLNEYADKTIYNFTEMTRNIGTFTAAGVDLDTSVNAIQGIANLAAVSGSNAQQASTAMYQLSQALAAGTVKLMDWNSVVNAGMGGQVFQDALTETARVHGIAIDDMIKKEGSFRETLHSGWLTSEILTETLQKFTLTTEGLTDAQIEANREMLRSKGYTEAQIDEIFKLGNTATNAATKVKTFTQLWDVLKESAQSGWTQTWELLIGDFEEAKNLLTPLADFLTGLINKFSKFRNSILEGALGKNFRGLFDTIKSVADPVKEVVNAVKDYAVVVDEIINGDWGRGQDRWNRLTEAGYDWAHAQNLVNEKLGSSVRHATNYAEAQEKVANAQDKTKKSQTELTKADKDRIKQLLKKSDAELKALGYTEKQIKAFNELKAVIEKTGIPMDEFIDKIDEIDGRWILLNSFKNIGNSLIQVFNTLKDAWQSIFPPKSIKERSESLFDLIAAFHKFTTRLKMSDNTADNLERTFKGLFAIIDIVATLTGGGLRIAFKAVKEILGLFDLDILDVTAHIGDAIVGFRDWIDDTLDFGAALEKVVPFIEDATTAFKTWFDNFKETPAVQDLVNAIEDIKSAFDDLTSGDVDISEFAKNLGSGLARALKSLPEIAIQIGKDFIAGFQEGIDFNISDIIQNIIDFCLDFVDGFKEALGVQSPSWKAHDTAVDFFQGFINGAKEMISKVVGVLEKIGIKIMEVFKSLWDAITDENGKIEWEKLFAVGVLISMAWFLKQLATAFAGIAEGIGGLGDLLDKAGDAVKKFGKVLTAYSWDLKARALLKLAISIGILAAAVFLLARIDDVGKLWNAVGIIAALAVVVVGMAWAMDKLSQASVSVGKNGAKLDGLKSGLLQIGIVLLLVAATVKLIGSMNPEEAKQGFIGLAGMAVGLLAFMAIMGLISRYTKDAKPFSSLLLKLSFALLLLVAVVKIIDGLSNEEIGKGVVFIAGFTLFVAGIARATKKFSGDVTKIGGMMITLAVAMGLMVGVMKLVSKLSVEDILKGAAFAAGFALFVKLLIWSTKIAKGQELAKIGGMIMSVSVSLMLMVGVCKLVGTLTGDEMLKGALFVAGFTVMLKALISILSIGSEQQMAKITGTIFAMSVAIAILAAVAVALGFVPLDGLVKGVAAVGLLGLVMIGMIKALKGAQNVKGSIMMMAVAIGIMAAAVAGLSFIETEKLIAASGSLAIVMGMFALIEKCSKDVSKSILTIGAMVVAVGLLAGILYLLSSNINDPNAAINTAIALGILMGALAVSLKMVGSAGALAKAAIGPMYAMTGVLAIVALIMGVLAALEVEPSIETAASLSILLMSLAGVTAVLTLVGAGAPAALGGIAAFAIVVAGVGAVMLALAGLNKLFPEMQSWLDTGIVILEKIGTGIGKFVGGLIGGIGEGLMDSLLDMVNTFEEVVEKLVEISDTGANINLDGFTGVEKLIDIIGSIGLTTVGSSLSDIFTLGGTSMEKFQTDGVAFFTAMKEIAKASEGVSVNEDSVDSVIGVAQKLSDLQSSLDPIGGVISWFTGRDDLGTFGANVGVFIDSMKTALGSLEGYEPNTEALEPIINTAQELATLQSSLEPIGGVISWFAGRDDLGTFGVNVGTFIVSMKTALSSLEGFEPNTEALEPIITAAQELATLQSSLEPIGGVISWFTGRDDLGTFGVNVGAFIGSMKTALASLDGIVLNEDALSSVISAATKLAEFQEQLEPIGGVISWFTGRDDLGTFGINLGLFGDAIGKLKAGMGENGISEDLIASVTNAGTAIIELQKSLPEEGWFDGKMNLTEFSEYVTDFGTAMKGFGEAAAGIDDSAVSASITTANRIKNLIESLVGLDTSGLEVFTGIGSGGIGADGAAYKIGQAISAYSEEVAGIDESAVSTSVSAAKKLKSLIASLTGLDPSGIDNFKVDSIGSAMKGYHDKVKNIDTGVVSSSISSAKRLKTLISELSGLDTSGISNFKPGTIGTAMKTYGTEVSKVSMGAISKSISAAKQLKNFISSLSGLNTDGVSSFTAALDELGTVSIDNIVKAFSGSSTKLLTAGSDMINALVNGMKSRQGALTTTTVSLTATIHKVFTSKMSVFKSSGAKLIVQFISGMTSKRSAISTAMTASLASAISSLRSKYQSFYSAGSYLVSGFAAGISANSYKASAKAAAMATAAAKAAKKALAINSPSKVFRAIGTSVPEGFAMGIDKFRGLVAASSVAMTKAALDNVKSSISRISDIVNSDIDAQPTIRPVVDLSNVQSGAKTISSLLSGDSSMGVLANVRTIGSMMNRRNQNGAESEIVTAINKLRKDLSNVGNTTYQVNGVTYDDGSNITDAVRTIVRAARVERRV